MTQNKVSRRAFLTGMTIVAPLSLTIARSSATPLKNTDQNAVLVDTRRCMNCKTCQVACKIWNDNPTDTTQEKTDFSPITWTYIKEKEFKSTEDATLKYEFAKNQCKHCLDPTCVSVCPTGAMYKHPNGPVLNDPVKCIGCRSCEMACPFEVPRFDEETKLIKKCVFCSDRLAAGMTPACVGTCISEALQFGDREEILSKAHASNAKYIYGEDELGGLSWIYISNVPLEALDFPIVSTEPPIKTTTLTTSTTPLTTSTSALTTVPEFNLIKPVASLGILGAIAMVGAYSRRRKNNAKKRNCL